ncbi:MAG: glutamate synthase large subunit [Sphingomonadales bacterium]
MTSNQSAAQWQKNAEYLRKHGLYDPATEHDNCGVGLIAAIDGKPRREIVTAGIEALKAVWHRGAIDADGKTGDGAGIHVEIPQDFFKKHVQMTGHEPRKGRLAVGMVFLPRTDFAAQEICRTIVETEILKFGNYIYGWRQVPVDISVIGDKANDTRPEIEQIMIANTHGIDSEAFERDLYIIRRRIEKKVADESINDFYICSLSCRSVIYKGMFLAEHLDRFYPDLVDPRFISSFAIYHQRYSTNTFPTWRLAQPFRMLAHNGEINTVKGNINWMKSHEIRMASLAFRDHSEEIKPIIQSGSSDSAALDAVFEVLARAGREAPLVKNFLIPEAWSKSTTMPESHRAMYAYVNSVMEPWDGPAAIAATDGRWVIAGMDRNGLRPMRYAITRDGKLIVGSETGMVSVPESRIIEKGRVGPGQAIGIDMREGRFFRDRALKDRLATERPYQEWVRNFRNFDDMVDEKAAEPIRFQGEELRQRKVAAGFTVEDMEHILHPLADDGKEPIGSMGDDTPLAVLSKKCRNLSHFFRQNFSQVTNPPIDPLREHRVMSLKTRFGNFGNVLDHESSYDNVLVLESPILTNKDYATLRDHFGATACDIDCTFDVDGGPDALADALQRIRREADDAVREGHSHVFLTDENISAKRAPVPMILAVGGVHSHLVREGLRTFSSLNVRASECLDTHYFAVLIGVGATTVNPYLVQDCIAERHERGLFGDISFDDCMARYRHAIDQGLLKIMSKMGISVISSYRGAYNFEALGLSRALAAEFFPTMPSRISGIGLAGVQKKALEQHAQAFDEDETALAIGGIYKYRRGGEVHSFEGGLIHTLQAAVANDSYSQYLVHSKALRELPPINLRDLLEFKTAEAPVPIEEVESITELRKRFITPGMSLGALSPEAHETLTIAMNRIGGKSSSGEGGEGPERFKPRPNGDNPNSTIKQVASGRFGVTAEYLNNCSEIEIKVAQGAKPGEGGQLPGFKVTVEIARLRHATPGVTLISPPPHHDIYSIEDLAQLIYDLKQINPDARVGVKLVASSGIGTIAAGVAKAKADIILISGHSGGTGASPQTSIKYAGGPWEMGLTEANQVLTLNNLRHRVVLRTDGGIKSGRDVVVAAMMGAEEFGIGTTALVALGCVMVRQCHSNTCPVGVCTQDESLREKFEGTADRIVNLFSFIAEEVREILSRLGVRTLDEIIGRTDLLQQVSRGAAHLDDLDLNPLLVQVDTGLNARFCTLDERNPVPDSLDAQMVEDASAVFSRGEKMQLTYTIRNTQRAIGTRLSSYIVRRYGMDGLRPGHITVRLRGSAGQSLGAFAVQGLKLEVFGDANDYVGKGLSGGTIVVRPMTSSTLDSWRNMIIGNTVLYGATSGALFAAGQAGERFAVRNSGAEVVVEGCGSNGCEYMTGGTAVILGPVGDNFAAGMTGGMAFVLDRDDEFHSRVNDESVTYQRVAAAHWEGVLRTLIERHSAETQSDLAANILEDWDLLLPSFWQVCPREMINRLEFPLSEKPEVAIQGA